MITRPSHVPVYGGCKPDCGHTDAEHICFDAGVYDGEHGRNDADDASIPIAEMSLPEFGAWQSGWTVGRMNRLQKAASVTGIEADVCADIAARQQVGIRKYGTTVEENPAPLRDWLQHAYEEALDLAVYLKRAIAEIDTMPL